MTDGEVYVAIKHVTSTISLLG